MGRQIEVINPLGHADSQSYDKAGQIIGETDALDHETLFFYDRAGRLLKVIQAYQPQPIVGNPIDDPAYWYWDAATGQWRDMRGDIVEHATDNARNLIVLMTYDKGGRMLTRREPRGNLTTLTYDKRDRRHTLTNPLNLTWETQYSDLPAGQTRESRIFPGSNGNTTPYTVQRDFDRAGRVESVQYGDATTTPNVALSYTLAGQRSLMDETGASGTMRTTEYTYDKAHRLTQVRFDVDGSSTYDEIVEYTYDAGGLRTQLKVVSDGSRTINYTYDAKGQPSAMSYVAGKQSGVSLLSSAEMTFTKTGWLKRLDRNPATNVLSSRYAYDAAGRLLQIKHIFDDATVLAQFDYTVNALGNRTQALERWLPNATDPMVVRTIQYAYDSASRLTGATYYPNLTGSGSPLHTYGYSYDWSGNRLTETLDSATRSFGYNAANQLVSEGAATLTYDLNGNLLNDGTNAYVWDRANRLRSMGGVSYAYDGDGDRHSRTVSSVLTRYTLDKQSPLRVVHSETTSGATKRFLHGLV